MQKAMLDKSRAYSKLSAKSRAEFMAGHGIAATCSTACWKFAIFMYQISAHIQNIQTYRERSNSVCVEVWNTYRTQRTGAKTKGKMNIEELYQNLKNMDGPSLGWPDYF